MVSVSIIIPTYNEAKNLPFLVGEIFEHLDSKKIDAEVIIVDDNSPDGTSEVAKKLGECFKVKVLKRSGKLGLGSAVLDGLSFSKAPYVGVMDADLSHDPAVLNELIFSLEHFDIALGSRFQGGSKVEEWVWWRKLLSKVGVFFAKLLTGVTDPLSGYFFLNRKVIKDKNLNTKGYKILLEILIKGSYKTVKEIPFIFRKRKFGNSKLNKTEYLLFLKQLFFYGGYKIKTWFCNKVVYFLRKCIKKVEPYLVYAILLLATVTRVYRIGLRDFWIDEAFTGITVGLPWEQVTDVLVRDTHPPLYFFSLKLFSLLCGNSVFGLRIFSALFGILGVLVIYLFTKELLSKKAALYTSFIAAINPFLWQYSEEARMYSMVGFFLVLSCYFFIKALKKNSWLWHIAWGITLGLSFLTHNIAIAFSPLFYIVFLVWNFGSTSTELFWHQYKKDWRAIFSFLKNTFFSIKLICGYVISGIIFYPWLNNFLIQFNDVDKRVSWIPAAEFADIFKTIHIFFVGTPLGQMGIPTANTIFKMSSLSTLIIITTLFSILTFILLKKQCKKTLILLLFSVGFMSIVYFLSWKEDIHVFISRYFIAAAYFIFSLCGLFLSQLKKHFALLAIAGYLLVLFFTNVSDYPTGYNKLIEEKKYTFYQNIYVLNSFDYTVAKYYFGKDRLILYNIDWPEYNPYDWAGVNGWLRRTEKKEEIFEDQNSILIFNRSLANDNVERREEFLTHFNLEATYHNILVYKPKKNN